MSSLKLAFHSTTGRRMVEVYDDSGRFVAAIYPGEDGLNGIHIASKHFDGPPTEPVSQVPVPSFMIKFTRLH